MEIVKELPEVFEDFGGPAFLPPCERVQGKRGSPGGFSPFFPRGGLASVPCRLAFPPP